MTVDIRRVGPGDASLLDSVDDDVFDNDIDPRHLAEFLNDPRHLMLVAIEDGVVIGMATGFEYFHPDKPRQLFINEVGVAARCQRRGIGRRLTEGLVEAARERGCVFAWLGTATDNLAGNACFASVPGGEEPEPFVLYQWNL